MAPDRALGWTSFWDLASPAQAARALVASYGPDATLAAAYCGLAACGDGREDDVRFWVAVFERLRAAQRPAAAAAIGPAPH